MSRDFTGNDLKEWIARHHTTQHAVAEALGISLVTLNRYANGKPIPPWLPLALATLSVEFNKEMEQAIQATVQQLRRQRTLLQEKARLDQEIARLRKQSPQPEPEEGTGE